MGFDGFARLVDTRPRGVVLSPSQIEKWDRCKRAWAFEYIGGMRPPPHPSAELGTLVHSILEAWLMYGTPPDIRTKAGKIAAKMIVNLPLPGTGVCERQFYFTTRNGFHYTGKIDWSGVFYGWPTVVDHKTTGDLKYAKTEAGLHCDTQGLSYTIAGCYGFEVDEMQLLWNYGTTKDREPIVQPVRTKVRLPIAEEKFERVIEPVASEIVSARNGRANPHSFPPNPLACDDFGGCPHRHVCQLTDHERISALMEQAQPTLQARLATMPMPGGFQQPGAPAPGTGFIPPTSAFSPPGGVPQGYGVQPALGGPPQAAFAPQVPPQTQPQQQQVVPGSVHFAPPGGQQQHPQQQQSYSFTPPGAAQQPQPQVAFAPNVGPNPPENGTQMQAAPQPQQEENKKRGRGRPKKSESSEEASVESIAAATEAVLMSDKQLFMLGVQSMISNPSWQGDPNQLKYAGDMAVQVFRAKFG